LLFWKEGVWGGEGRGCNNKNNNYVCMDYVVIYYVVLFLCNIVTCNVKEKSRNARFRRMCSSLDVAASEWKGESWGL
jgi:hypothetical protein